MDKLKKHPRARLKKYWRIKNIDQKGIVHVQFSDEYNRLTGFIGLTKNITHLLE